MSAVPRFPVAVPRAQRIVSAAAVIALLSAVPLLGGCVLGAAAVVNAIPAAIGTTAMMGTDAYSPFVERAYAPSDTEDEGAMARLDAAIHAAECGDARSQYRLAASLENGFNRTPDRVEVLKWYRLAEAGGDARAAEARARLESAMPAAEIAASEARADDWVPRTEDCPATG